MKKAFTQDELDMMYEALSLYLAGGAHMAIGFFDYDTDELVDKSAFENEDDAVNFLEGGKGYMRPFASKQPEHRLTSKEKAQIMMILQHISELQSASESKPEIPSEEDIDKIVKDNINDVVAGFYKMFRENG